MVTTNQTNNWLTLVQVWLDQWKIWPLSDFCKITKEFQNYEISVRFYLIYGIQADSISCDISWSWWGPRYNPSAKEAIRWWFHLSLWHQLLHQPLFSLFGIPKWKIALYPDCKQFLKSSLHMELGSFFLSFVDITLYIHSDVCVNVQSISNSWKLCQNCRQECRGNKYTQFSQTQVVAILNESNNLKRSSTAFMWKKNFRFELGSKGR